MTPLPFYFPATIDKIGRQEMNRYKVSHTLGAQVLLM